ncbi:MAG: hypothetical protein R3B46_04110 [Phycisphaerales bacterium]|nr:hypothetical protein [Phycisphaerales bacterium]
MKYALMLCASLATTHLGWGAEMPIREVTAFKDGHALVLRSGVIGVGASGEVVLEDLPRPVMGTFWAQSGTAAARLASVSVARTVIEESRPATSIEDMLRANIGKRIAFRHRTDDRREGTLINVIEREWDATPQPVVNNYGRVTRYPNQSGVQRLALIRQENAVAAIPVLEIVDLLFLDAAPETTIVEQVEQERMTLDLAWNGGPASEADVSLMYLQRGVRWIPSYRVTMLDDGHVRIELQATIVNELADLDDVTMHFAVGVPSFAFEQTLDPIALRESMDALGMYFTRADEGQTAGMFSNAIMAQSARRLAEGVVGDNSGGSADTPPELTGSERAEDLFVYTARHITLAKGARMVIPLASYVSPAESVYRLDLPATPPSMAWRNFQNEQQREIAKMLAEPRARHILRITNESPDALPITTAPALVVKDGRALAQGLITYTSPGATVDLEVGVAVDIAVETDEVEGSRAARNLEWNDNHYARIDIAFDAELKNRKPHPVRLEVRKFAFGLPDDVSAPGEFDALSVFAAEDAWTNAEYQWWRWYSWPWYWHRLNGAARYTWTIDLEPGASTTIEAKWHYFWN